jgi:hypothetical protein
MKGFTVFLFFKNYYLGNQIKEDVIKRTCIRRGKKIKVFNIWSENEKTRDHLEYVWIDGRTIIK